SIPLQPPAPPDALARTYMQKAGFRAADLDVVTPLLRRAEMNTRLERGPAPRPVLDTPKAQGPAPARTSALAVPPPPRYHKFVARRPPPEGGGGRATLLGGFALRGRNVFG